MSPPAIPVRPRRPLLRRIADRVRRTVRDWWRGETDDTFFDVHNLRALNAILARHDVPPVHADPRQAEAGVPGAARFVLGLLASDRRLRRRFPDALSAGPGGAFCEWLATAGPARYGLSAGAIANVRAAFVAGSERIKRIYELREDMRTVFVFGMTPHPDRAKFLNWILTHGSSDCGQTLTPEEAVWFFYERDETPDRGLVPSYLLEPSWQRAVPHALTPFGWAEFVQYLRGRYGIGGRWLDRAVLVPPYRPWDDLTLLRRAKPVLGETFPEAAGRAGDADAVIAWLAARPDLPAVSVDWRRRLREDITAGVPVAPSVNVLGHFRYTSGLQEAAAGIVTAVERAGGRVARRDLPVLYEADWTDRERYQGVELFDTTVYVASVNTFPDLWYPRCGLDRRAGVRRIAVWYWELEDLPPEWLDQIGWADEGWAPTRFIADAFRKHVSFPVVPMLPGIELPAFAPKPRAHFGLSDDRFLFLFSFDMNSVMLRKNPLAVIEAFRRAFRPGDGAHLVIKVSRGQANPTGFAQLTAAAAAVPNVTLVNRILPREDTLALLATADCYVSLHRSEGLGLGMAESMLMGKPVIATAYSGNMDFMTPDTSYLVDYRKVPITEDLFPYPKGCLWAEPSVEHAADLMRRVFDRREDARAVGARAQATLRELLPMKAYSERLLARLTNRAPAGG
ncbi:glycosyltransferase family 4 protein [Fimbriiglobus ruber]|uniref:Glycosyltransferase n=1 Tax=Fimbriiglobus ruber TaxID=1908690 RepID=A0A225DUS5_9BACT|nr:glycosyltransferase family 4 protein [Fimbriiglobus ruber]OWK45270.1 Glycosyltransferase [Fimbriiglobus ruber]